MKKLTLSHFKSCLVFPNRPVLSIILWGLTLGAGGLLGLTDREIHHEKKKSTLVISQLEQLQNQIATLHDAVSKPSAKVDLSAMTQQITALSQQLEDVRAQNISHVDQTLNQTEAALVSRLDAIQEIIRHLDSKQAAIKFLDPKTLPFRVLSIDSIQHIPVASITYDFKTLPLEQGDTLAGWRVLHIDYGKQRMEFENTQKERVCLTHKYIG